MAVMELKTRADIWVGAAEAVTVGVLMDPEEKAALVRDPVMEVPAAMALRVLQITPQVAAQALLEKFPGFTVMAVTAETERAEIRVFQLSTQVVWAETVVPVGVSQNTRFL